MAASARFLAKRASFLAKLYQRRNLIYSGAPVMNISARIYQKHFSSGTVKLTDDSLNEKDVKSRMDILTDKFTEARELMDDARESEGTVYFTEDLEEAQQAVKETLEEYNSLLSELSDKQRQNVISSLGLRMEELKAQQAAIEESLKDH